MPYGFIFSDFYEASIRHDRSLDSPPFITVKATDVDSGDNGKVDYELQDSSDFFTVGSTDGGIRLKAAPPSGRFFSLLLQSISKTSEHCRSSSHLLNTLSIVHRFLYVP